MRVRRREEFSEGELRDLKRWLEDAFGEGPWRAEFWSELGPGPHFLIEDDDGDLLAHACIASVPVTVGETPLDAGYLEVVATRADVRGGGLGSAVVEAASRMISEENEIGFLGTGSFAFYERLGWVRWKGPSAVTERDGSTTPTPEDDENIMALFVPRTPSSVSVTDPIVRPRRDPDEAW
ncbi:MAG: GNAT family N-acetyltransferase [Actinomycetota bacterium]